MITCDECGAQFQQQIREYALANGGVRQALICPSCERQYPVAAITPLGVRLRERLSRMRRIQQSTNTLPGAEYHDLLARYRAEVTRLTSGKAPDERIANEPVVSEFAGSAE